MIEKVFMQYDPALSRAIGSINLDDYTPTKTPSSASGFIWKQLRQIRIALPAMFWGFCYKDKAMDEYKEFVDKLMERFNSSNDAGCTSDFETLVTSTLSEYCAVAMSAMARIVAAYWSRYRLNRLFQGQEGADDLLISLCMDLKGNPTSEMGHAMVRLASMPEIQTTASGEEFCRKLEEDGAFSDEFMEQYHDFLNRYGCRGMKEIDIASTRTSEDPAGLFRRLKEIDIEHNAIINVSQRRQHAHDKLLDMAKAMGKEETFKYHDNIIQHLLGYRENPKYICKCFCKVDRDGSDVA
jgi:rifampicin phosphotransferase